MCLSFKDKQEDGPLSYSGIPESKRPAEERVFQEWVVLTQKMESEGWFILLISSVRFYPVWFIRKIEPSHF